MEVTEDGTIFTCTLHHFRLHHLHLKFILQKMVVFLVRGLITGDGGIQVQILFTVDSKIFDYILFYRGWYYSQNHLLQEARFLKVCRYDQFRRNSCYDELGCNSLVVTVMLLRPAQSERYGQLSCNVTASLVVTLWSDQS